MALGSSFKSLNSEQLSLNFVKGNGYEKGWRGGGGGKRQAIHMSVDYRLTLFSNNLLLGALQEAVGPETFLPGSNSTHRADGRRSFCRMTQLRSQQKR